MRVPRLHPGQPLLVSLLAIALSAMALAGCCACGSKPNGNHIQPGQHSVTLSWTASNSSDVVGYDVFRGTQHNGPYPTKLNSSPQAGATFTDSTVQSGVTYYYVVTAENTNHVQSDYSNEVTAVVP